MPGFFNSMTQAVGSYLRNLKASASSTVGASFTDFDLGDPLSGQQGSAADVIAEAALDDIAPTEDNDSSLSNFVTEAERNVLATLRADGIKIAKQPRGLALVLGTVLGRIAEFLPSSNRANRLDDTTIYQKVLGVLQKGLSIEKYRPEVVNGRIVGKHSKLYMLLSYLNEFINPRQEGVDMLAYFRNSVDSEGKAIRETALRTDDVGTATPTTLSALAGALKNPNKMKEVLRGIANIGKVDRAKFLRIADQYLVEARARMRAATEDLAAGRITVRQYRRTMVVEIKRTILAEVILNIGGVGNLTDEVMKGVHQRISQDIRGLDAFIREIKGRGDKEDGLFTVEGASRPDNRGRAPQVDSDTLATINSALAGADPVGTASSGIIDDSYVEDGIMTASDLEAGGDLAEGGYLEGQAAFRTLLIQNANEYQLLEVRRLEEGIENCDFCIAWADKPMPPGQLPAVGDPGCLGVKYNTGGCHCKMDTVSEDEAESAAEGPGDDNG